MSNVAGHSYFRQEGDLFIGNDAARGPWSEQHCHAGPVAALTVRAAEHLFPAPFQILRITLDLLRPVPIDGITVTAQALRKSRSVAAAEVAVQDRAGKTCVPGHTMHLISQDIGAVPSPVEPASEFDTAEPLAFPLARAQDLPCFTDFTDIRYPPGQGPGVGPKTVWMRFPGIVDGETPSAFQKLCPLADSSNGISGNAPLKDFTFLNTDLTIAMHRPMEGDWLASQARSHWQPTGNGLADAVLSDRIGPVAQALQTLILRRR